VRLFPVAIGLLWFLFWTGVTYRHCSASAPGAAQIAIQRGALPVPAATPSQPAEPRLTPAAEVIAAAPDVYEPAREEPPPTSLSLQPRRRIASPRDLGVGSPYRNVPVLPEAGTMARLPRPASAPATRDTSDATPPPVVSSPPPAKPKYDPETTARLGASTVPTRPEERFAACLVCGGRSESWVEVDGKRLGYCRRHLSKPDRVDRFTRPSRTRATVVPQSPPDEPVPVPAPVVATPEPAASVPPAKPGVEVPEPASPEVQRKSDPAGGPPDAP
jgi:hypothetical protein